MSKVKCVYQSDGLQFAVDEHNVLWLRVAVSDSRYGGRWSAWEPINLDPREWMKIPIDRVKIRDDKESKEKYGKVREDFLTVIELMK